MQMLLLDLSRIKAQAKEKESENNAFAKFLRQFPSSTLDPLIESLSDAIEPDIDCKACANCCKGLYAAAHEDELLALAQAKGMSIDGFKETFVKPYKEAYYFRTKPCPMLRENLCIAYDARPVCCRTFPNLKGEHFKYRFQSVMEKYPICPIVFNVVEVLKEALSFPKKCADLNVNP
ncbi:MAG: YkgJ family cysteine cluster protein [Chloroherpetonaceae bacterium]